MPKARIGLSLTESYAMWPGSSVSGLYLAHPDSSYFAVGRVQRDQVESYAERKGVTVEAAERLLGTTLAYTPHRRSARDVPAPPIRKSGVLPSGSGF